MSDDAQNELEAWVERTRSPRANPAVMRDAAAAFEAIGTERALLHAAFTRIRAAAMVGDLDVATETLEDLSARFLRGGDENAHARVLFFRGWLLQTNGHYADALAMYDRCMEIVERQEDHFFIGSTLTQIGTVYMATGDAPAALLAFGRARQAYNVIDERTGIAGTMSNIGTVYLTVNDLERAYHAFQEAIPLHEANHDLKFLATTLNNVGVIHYLRNEFDRAVELFRRTLDLRMQLHDPVAVVEARGTLAETLLAAGDEKAARELLATIREDEVPDPQFRINMMVARARLQALDGDPVGARDGYVQALDVANTYAIPSRQLDVHRALRDLAQQQNDLAAYIEHSTAITALTERMSGASTARHITEIEKERELAVQREQLDQHRSALHATLPKHVADRVIRGEHINDHFDDAAVLFADIAGFTAHTSGMQATDVVSFLERIFAAFDVICERHGVTKVKTIGDSYMCFIGDHDATTNCLAMAGVACEMIAASFVWPSTNEPLLVRVGMHVGPVTAGVLGTTRLQYDVWGDTVNVASRMESSGIAGRCQISKAVVDALENTTYRIQDRGEIEVKGKGMMRTFWLERRVE